MRSLELAIKYLAGDRIIGTAAERAALSGSTPTSTPQTSWKLLSRTVGSGDTLNSGTITAKDNLMILVHTMSGSSQCTGNLQFNSDTGSNYHRTISTNGASDSSSLTTSLIMGYGSSGEDTFSVIHIKNIAAEEKLIIGHVMSGNAEGTGGSGLPNRREVYGKWANTSNQITSF